MARLGVWNEWSGKEWSCVAWIFCRRREELGERGAKFTDLLCGVSWSEIEGGVEIVEMGEAERGSMCAG